MSNQRAAKISMTPRSILVPCRRNRGCADTMQLPHPRAFASGTIGLLGLMSIWLDPQHPVSAQIPAVITKTTATTYEDDRVKVVVGQCNRKLQELICQATLTSKNSDRIVNINTNNVKLVDFEGNEYYPSLLKLANRTSENNLIRTELVENVPFKASFIFPKIPTSVNKIALLQIQLSGGLDINAKFRNLVASDLKPVKPIATPAPVLKTATIVPDMGIDNSSICPDRTKIFYRATTKHYALYICGNRNPTHYVGLARDGSQGITLRLRYYDRTQFSADNGNTNYTIAADRLTISKDDRVIYRHRIQVLQPLPGTTVAESAVPKTNLRKNTTTSNNLTQKRTSTPKTDVKIERRTGNNESRISID
jgi:hypothetical protein